MNGLSPIATHAQIRRCRPRRGDPWGLVVHTTGSTLVARARAHRADPLEYAVSYYLRPDSYHPHYVCGWDGALVQICDELQVAPHVGMSAADLAAYRSGSWSHRIDATHWRRAWEHRGFSSPLELYPGRSPNSVYVGIELLPLEQTGERGLRFTIAQHDRVSQLAGDIAARYLLGHAVGRWVGHEDVTPVSRWDAGGGWDPGARRATPRFDWAALGLP
jgi:N-acetyl-anhydromuramyl-L-alanine amidase AmpD